MIDMFEEVDWKKFFYDYFIVLITTLLVSIPIEWFQSVGVRSFDFQNILVWIVIGLISTSIFKAVKRNAIYNGLIFLILGFILSFFLKGTGITGIINRVLVATIGWFYLAGYAPVVLLWSIDKEESFSKKIIYWFWGLLFVNFLLAAILKLNLISIVVILSLLATIIYPLLILIKELQKQQTPPKRKKRH